MLMHKLEKRIILMAQCRIVLILILAIFKNETTKYMHQLSKMQTIFFYYSNKQTNLLYIDF